MNVMFFIMNLIKFRNINFLIFELREGCLILEIILIVIVGLFGIICM